MFSSRHEKIRRLYVAMDDPTFMGGIQGIGNLDAERQHHVDFKRLASDAMFQCYAIEIFHGDKRLSVLIVDLVDRADVRMVQSGSRLRFPLKTAERLCILRDFIRQELERYKASKLYIFGLVNHAHPAAGACR